MVLFEMFAGGKAPYHDFERNMRSSKPECSSYYETRCYKVIYSNSFHSQYKKRCTKIVNYLGPKEEFYHFPKNYFRVFTFTYTKIFAIK